MSEGCVFCRMASNPDLPHLVYADGPAAFQEVPHLHIHVHPRKRNDHFLKVYPSDPPTPEWPVLREYAAAVRACLPPIAARTEERKEGGQ